jgi:hypothetical protein
MSEPVTRPLSTLLLTFNETCRVFRIGKTKLNQLCNSGDLDRRKIGSRTIITMASVEQFLERVNVEEAGEASLATEAQPVIMYIHDRCA